MPRQHRFAAPVTVTQNVARVDSLTYHPHRNARTRAGATASGSVEVFFRIGEETDGVFTEKSHATLSYAFDDLPPALQTTFASLEASALSFGAAQGLFPSGDEEPAPEPVRVREEPA